MKKIILTSVVVSLFLFLLVGCKNEENKKSQPAITQNIATNPDSTLTDIQTDKVSDTVPLTTTQTNSQNDVYNLSSYEKRIHTIVKEITNASTSSDYQTNYETFYNLSQKIGNIENELDTIEDLIEYDYKANKLSFDDYRSYERSLDTLEDSLELAEEALENKFNMDD